MNSRNNFSIVVSTIYVINFHRLFLLIVRKHMKQSMSLHFYCHSFTKYCQFLCNISNRPIARRIFWLTIVAFVFTQIFALLKIIYLHIQLYTLCISIFASLFFSFVGMFKRSMINQAARLNAERHTILIDILSLVKKILINHAIYLRARR